ncbi:adhesion g protein-coupled receptor l3 [Plakobranchus ocellatus]|uniref:Adhesion g protein-coupled receptor l3 n=1 Tax=Plakobranchus ocellatus TaxID=259542 RepID=A0AAV4BB05_9GAST|nr:adhesion g protein-coupled receptor l3 [Plakobranchus ocellatus]
MHSYDDDNDTIIAAITIIIINTKYGGDHDDDDDDMIMMMMRIMLLVKMPMTYNKKHDCLTWIFGFLAIEDARLVFQYLFCITASLQGVIIFMMTARDPQVRQYWLQRVCCCLHRWTKAQSISISSSSSRAGSNQTSKTDKLTTSVNSTITVSSELDSFNTETEISTTSVNSTTATSAE